MFGCTLQTRKEMQHHLEPKPEKTSGFGQSFHEYKIWIKQNSWTFVLPISHWHQTALLLVNVFFTTTGVLLWDKRTYLLLIGWQRDPQAALYQFCSVEGCSGMTHGWVLTMHTSGVNGCTHSRASLVWLLCMPNPSTWGQCCIYYGFSHSLWRFLFKPSAE